MIDIKGVTFEVAYSKPYDPADSSLIYWAKYKIPGGRAICVSGADINAFESLEAFKEAVYPEIQQKVEEYVQSHQRDTQENE